ncbi:MAG TPA: outer membrane beta-barrel protein [Verrucomicrobiae bacterium]|jgi:hypothetical protein|nr:outer membrane beta-barrel protein [Verrucomicrobiae bacterium]
MKTLRTRSFSVTLLRLFLAVIFCAGLVLPAHFAAAQETKAGTILDRIDDFMNEGPIARIKSQLQRNYGLMINPYFKTGFEYTSNVFKIPRGPRTQDELWTFSPGFNATHTSKYGEIGLNYEAQLRYFTRQEKQNQQDQSFGVYANLFPADGFNLKLSEELVQQGSTAGAPGVEPLDSSDNTVRASLIYDVDENLTGELGYKNFSRHYAGDTFESFSYYENEYFVEGQYKVAENHTVIAGYHLGTIDYIETSSRNAIYHQFPVGMRGMLPYGVEYDATVAAYVRNQEASARNDFFWFTGSIDLKKKITEKTSVGAGFIRRPVESTYDNAEVSDDKTFYANLTHRFTPRVRGRFDISHTNRDFENSATIGGVTVKRDDDLFALGVGLDYALRKWMIVNVDYRVERRDSNLSTFDYTENRLLVGATVPL